MDDPFFDSLKTGYAEFPQWFSAKSNEDLYVVDDGKRLSGMLYLKREAGPITDIQPNLPDRVWLKVGTLKIIGKGTKLGERVLKKVFDTAISSDADGIYVTVFEVHSKLIKLFKKYGFVEFATKTTANGIEKVLVRDMNKFTGNLITDYPFIHTNEKSSWLLAVYPEYHSRLLPDSILNNEPKEIIQDVSHTNTIHKVYVGKLSLTRMSPGDAVILYRTSDGLAPARYRSVATSVCVVEEVRKKKDFVNVEDYIAYCKPHSVFSERELREQFLTWPRLYVAKMTYNAAFNRRTTRGSLMDDAGISEQPRWDFRELTHTQFRTILELGQVNARLIVN
ncbi:hypothetical protein [Azospirillum palustre]